MVKIADSEVFFKGIQDQGKKGDYMHHANVCILIYEYICSTMHHICYKTHAKVRTYKAIISKYNHMFFFILPICQHWLQQCRQA